ncbi:helix-turn-helix domain-containing protein [Desulfovirgula thermocuniculi]|uniref:helix-turn-helix domain-containing protein n=1 Tax=Desulfovirgula thermocuniculi TaxID=348842 RepID=UPI000403E565|nr:helix-turn-helix domain-containing protein [Desulfovirgula thermocuniculi]
MRSEAKAVLPDLPEFLTVGEVAALLRLGRSTAYELIRRGEIPSFRVGRHIRIPRRELERLAAGKGTGRDK